MMDISHLQQQSSIQKLKAVVNVEEIIKESHQHENIRLRALGCKESIWMNKFLLAACSSLFKTYLELEEDADQIILTDCCITSLKLVLQYALNGYVLVQDPEMRQKVSLLIKSLQIGQFTLQSSKKEPIDNGVSFVKEEPPNNEDNLVHSYLNHIKQIDKQNKSGDDSKSQWRDDILHSLYKENTEFTENYDSWMEDDNYEEEDEYEEYSKPKRKVSKVKKSNFYNCSECAKSFNSQIKLDNHKLKKHVASVTLKCEHCPKEFKNLHDKKVHEDTHSRPFKCDECDASFGRKSNLIGHKRVHRGERPYMCDICGKSFPMQSSVTTHKKQSHPNGDKPWVCEYCERRFVSKSQLELHRRVHTGEKPWVCDVCGKGFAQKQNMLDHKRVHSDKMEFNCHTCGKQFKWKLQLDRHMMDHSGARPFPCDKCNLAFKCRNGLKSHKLSVHSETKHFVCQHCGSGFSTSSGVSRHQKQNRCSGLKALGENVTSRQNSNTGSQIVGNGTNANIAKVEGKIHEPLEKDNTAIIQSMQYLQNIAAHM